MHVAIVGAGSLGRVFGARLASAGVAVDFVVREMAPSGAIRVENVASGEATSIGAPSRIGALPAHADVVLLCVRADQLDDALVESLRAGPSVPIVAVTPMLPLTFARLRALLGARLVTAMSSVVGYTNGEGVTRYWVSTAAKTLIDEPHTAEPALVALVESLGRAGIAARFEPAVHATNTATTLRFLPLTFGLDVAGSIDGLLNDAPLLATMFRAADEARKLGDRYGKVAFWTGLVTRFLGPHTIRMGLALGRSRAPEAIGFIDEHFGRKAHAQNLAMAIETCALAEEKATPHAALDELLARLRGCRA